MIFDYSFKPEKHDLLVTLIKEDSKDFYSNIEEKIALNAFKYGINFIPYDQIDKKQHENSIFKHIIILVHSNNLLKTMEKYEPLLSWFNCMSVGFIYKDKANMQKSRAIIEELKNKFQDNVNFLRPDIEVNQHWLCSEIKILDNMICDTIRIKYNPVKINNRIPPLNSDFQQYFSEVSHLFQKYRLYHRSASDGFFAIRDEKGIFITATKTYKDKFDILRLAYVHDYNKRTNTMTYSGPFLPSSDAVEAWMVFKNHPKITAIIHTHASDIFTRNLKYQDRIAVLKTSYGTSEVGHEICKKIHTYLDNFMIIEEHGEYFSFTGKPEGIVSKFEAILQREASTYLTSSCI